MAARILIIDDEPPLLESITDILELSGYEIITAPDGVAGLHRMKADRPQLVLCDLMMPGADGYAVLREAQADERIAHIPVVFVSAKADTGTIQRSLNSGAVAFLSKPFALDELLSIVEQHLVEPSR